MQPSLCASVMIVSALAVYFLAVGRTSGEPESAGPGERAPSWKDLIGTDDRKHSLTSEMARIVVVVFTCNSCPVAQAYEDRLVKFAADYRGRGVGVVAINPSNLSEDSLDSMKKRAKEKGFTFPYLHDSTQKVAEEYGVKVTPHWCVLDAERRIAYQGSFDDNQDPNQAKKPYLARAVQALLSGKRPEAKEMKAFGCGIRYEKR